MPVVFDEEVADLLRKVDDVVEGGFGERSFDVDPQMVRGHAAAGTFSSNPDPTNLVAPKGNGASHHKAFLAATIGALLERHAVWGALFNYPRTVIIGPEASFACSLTTPGRYFKWNDTLLVDSNVYKQIKPRDVDQIIWLNHCPDGVGAYKPVIEIGVLRLNHESRSEAAFVPTLGATRLVTNGTDETYFAEAILPDDWRKKKRAEAGLILAHLFGDGMYNFGNSENWPYVPFSEPAAPKEDGDSTDYLKRCASVLERVMRDRTSQLRYILNFDPSVHVTPELMYKAVSARQVPYASVDLDADNGQPAVMPGVVGSLDSIVDVLGSVIGYGSMSMPVPTKVTVTGTASRYSALFDDEPQDAIARTSSPYDAFDDDDDDDDDDANGGYDFAGGELSPFSSSEDEFGF